MKLGTLPCLALLIVLSIASAAAQTGGYTATKIAEGPIGTFTTGGGAYYNPAINDFGDVAYSVSLGSGHTAIHRFNADTGQITTIADNFSGSFGRPFSSFRLGGINNAGEVAFAAWLSGGGAGIYKGTGGAVTPIAEVGGAAGITAFAGVPEVDINNSGVVAFFAFTSLPGMTQAIFTGSGGGPLTTIAGSSGLSDPNLIRLETGVSLILSGSVEIPGNQASVPIAVTPLSDSLAEGDETVVLTLAPGDGYVIGGIAVATMNLQDVPPPPTSVPVMLRVTDGAASVFHTANDPMSGQLVAGSAPNMGNFEFDADRSVVVRFSLGGSAVRSVDYELDELRWHRFHQFGQWITESEWVLAPSGETLNGSIQVIGSGPATEVLISAFRVRPIRPTPVEKNVVVTVLPGESYFPSGPSTGTIVIESSTDGALRIIAMLKRDLEVELSSHPGRLWSLLAKLNVAAASLRRGNSGAARNQLQALRNEMDAHGYIRWPRIVDDLINGF